MRNSLDNIEIQVRKAAVNYYNQDLETFFLPTKGDKTLDELIQVETGFDKVDKIASYAYGSMIEFELINYRTRRNKDVTAKLKLTVNYDIIDGVCNKVDIKFGI